MYYSKRDRYPSWHVLTWGLLSKGYLNRFNIDTIPGNVGPVSPLPCLFFS